MIFKIWIAYIMDLIFGDPHWFPHPVRIIGSYISFLEKYLYRLKNKKIAGGVLALTVVITTMLLSYELSNISKYLEIFFLYTTLATKSLGKESLKIYKILEEKDLELAKEKISYLVSRETNEMDEEQIIKSTVETVAENSVDGIISPLFYAFLGSYLDFALVFAMGYKAINTLDSMVGYKNERYKDFGFFSAKIDDIVNFIPARITGGLIIPIGAFILRMDYKNAWKIFFRDRLNHSSPNSGHPEASFAGALGVQFGGKTKYFGKWQDKAIIGDKLKHFSISDIRKAVKLLYVSSWVGLLLFTILYQFINTLI